MGFEVGSGMLCAFDGLAYLLGEGDDLPRIPPHGSLPIPFRPLAGVRSAETPWTRLRKIRALGCLVGPGISVTP